MRQAPRNSRASVRDPESENGSDALSDENVAEGRDRHGVECMLAYDLTRLINIVGVCSLIAAMKA
jgi:hypothetical protein